MTLAYLPRLACLVLASFFLLQTVFTAGIWLLSPAAIRLASRLCPRQAADFLFMLRLLPSALAFSLVVLVCAPSYFWLETPDTYEEVGAVCWLAATLGLAGVCSALARSLTALRRCRQRFSQAVLPPHRLVVVDAPDPLLALAGVWRPQLFISRTLLETLSPDHLAAALRHEEAHRRAHDNFKRLLLLLAPDVLPKVRLLASLEQAWARFSEWAADDESAGGDPERSLALAGALVQFARMGTPAIPPLPLSLLLSDRQAFGARVERLISDAPSPSASLPGFPFAWILGVAGLLAVEPFVLQPVHQALELLMR